MRDITGGHDWHLQEVLAFIDLSSHSVGCQSMAPISEIIMHG